MTYGNSDNDNASLCVSSDVPCKTAFVTKSHLAIMTLIKLLFGVSSDVNCKLATFYDKLFWQYPHS